MRYVIRRVLQSIMVVSGVSIVAFEMMFLTGDPLRPFSATGPTG